MTEEQNAPYFLMCGKMEELLKDIPDNYFDAIVTDPPYGLKFMGKKWDYQVPTIEQWAEVLRVLKPGAYLLSFGGSRTFHRMAVNVEDAGFEIRDTIMWIYGSGFPKSVDISKAIDKAKGADREVVGVKPGHEEFVHRKTKGHIEFKNGTAGYDRPWMHDDEKREAYHLQTAPSTDLAKEWEGWGTALKPAFEPIIVARKPLIGTVVENVETWGVGGINIDGCRVEYETRTNSSKPKAERTGFVKGFIEGTDTVIHDHGRFPANIIHDGSDEVKSLFPDSKGQIGRASVSLEKSKNKVFSKNKNFTKNPEPRFDSGSAARFFYCAKASKLDRNEGMQEDNDHPTVKPTELMRYLVKLVTPKGGIILDPFVGSGSTGKAAMLEGFEFVGIDQDENVCQLQLKE